MKQSRVLKSLSASGLSFHLSQLEQAGLLTSRKESRHVIYAADRTALGEVIAYLLNDCCAGAADVSACMGAKCNVPPSTEQT